MFANASNPLHFFVMAVAAAMLTVATASADNEPVGDVFTYQGQLLQDGEPVNGPVNIEFRLFDSQDGENQIGPTVSIDGFVIEDGLFTIDLAFGSDVFTGEERWLEIEVDGVVLSPRQPIMPAPYAMVATTAANVPTKAVVGNYSGITGVGTLDDLNVSGNVGIGVTNPAVPLQVSGRLIAGATENIATGINSFVVGGSPTNPNISSGDYASVAGGWGNVAGGDRSAIGGGRRNHASGMQSTIAGGSDNETLHNFATISGGSGNTAEAAYSTVAGGNDNEATGLNAVVSGGRNNTASATHATISGGEGNLANGSRATIGGGRNNEATDTYSTIAGGFLNTASGQLSFIGGGDANTASGNRAAIVGGWNNLASNDRSFVGGGEDNAATGIYSFVGGGFDNTAHGVYTAVGGGEDNLAWGGRATVAGGAENVALGLRTTISGGSLNEATGVAATIAGGENNQANGWHSAIGGGEDNETDGSHATIGGGENNQTDGDYAVVAGGRDNFAEANRSAIVGGDGNLASGSHAFIGGGRENTASGAHAMIPGGWGNEASGNRSFAAGRNARALHSGTFVWADNNLGTFSSTEMNQFLIRADGGVGIGTNDPQAALHVSGITRTDVIQITGADLAEEFPFSEQAEHGMVVAIDPDSPGELCISRGAYNRRVAGIIAGANDFETGIVLGRDSGNEFGKPVALSGRVYVKVDATERAVEPGDMLTTADMPGYAMRADDFQKAQGAIIGKAMERLEQGERGMILVLVNLQ